VVIFLAFGAAGVRVALMVGGAIILLGIVFIGGYLALDSVQKEASKHRIPVSDVKFDDMRLGVGTRDVSRVTDTTCRFVLLLLR